MTNEEFMNTRNPNIGPVCKDITRSTLKSLSTGELVSVLENFSNEDLEKLSIVIDSILFERDLKTNDTESKL